MRLDAGMMQVDPILQAHRGLVISIAAVVPLAACAVLGVFRDSIANTNAALVLVLLIVAAAASGMRAAGLAAAVSSAVWFDFFLTAPYTQFAITDPADVETDVLLLLVGLAVTEIALWGRRQQARASRERGYLDGVLTTAAAVGTGRSSTSSLIDGVREQILEVLQIDDCRFDDGTLPVLATLNNDATMTYDGKPYDVRRNGLPTDTEIALLVQSAGVPRGRFLLTAATRVVRPTVEQLRVVIALSDQVGAALSAASHREGQPPAGAAG
jgi:hypothetical protein